MAWLPNTTVPKTWTRARVVGVCALALLGLAGGLPGRANHLPQYQIKAGFIYNFAVLTNWPMDVGDILKLCVYGRDAFGAELDALNKTVVGTRVLMVERKSDLESLKSCQLVYIPQAESPRTARILDLLRGLPILTIAESPGALAMGVMLNLRMANERITFEVNPGVARRVGLSFNAKLLRLASEVKP